MHMSIFQPPTHQRLPPAQSLVICDSWVPALAPTNPAVLGARTTALRGRRQTTPQHKPRTTHAKQACPAMTLATRLVERHQTARHRLRKVPGQLVPDMSLPATLVNLTADCTVTLTLVQGQGADDLRQPYGRKRARI